jgi:hypothetical protein
LFFLAFVEATRRYQVVTSLRGPLLVGFFLLALVIHGGIEQWWIEPVLSTDDWRTRKGDENAERGQVKYPPTTLSPAAK